MNPNISKPGEPTATILVVDDDAFNRILVDALLDDQGYRVVMAESGAEALDRVADDPPDAILLDVMMPGLDGFEVCRRLKASRRTYYIPVVMLTALADRQSRIRGLDAGADEFLNKPIDRIEVLTRLRAMLRIHALRDELDSADSVILSLVTAQEIKGGNRHSGHASRVAHLASRAAQVLDLNAGQRETILWGALLHDIGKIGSADAILEQPTGQMSAETLEIYRQHPLVGERLLEPLLSLAKARPLVRHHHERLDGSGYPDGLRGDAFSLEIELVAAANAFEGFCDASGPSMAPELLQVAAHRGAFRDSSVQAILCAAELLPEEPGHPFELLPPPSLQHQGHVFLADDNAVNREIFQEHLSAAGCQVTTFADGHLLLEAMQEEPPDLVMLDVNMPRMGGEEVCRRLRADMRYNPLPIVLVTAQLESLGKESALACGADDFLTLPLDRQELLARVRSLLRLRMYQQDLEAREAIVISFSQLLEAKDPYTQGHSQRVGDLARSLALQMGLGREFAEKLATAGLLHDIGKVAVPDRILHKPGPLDDEEMRILRSHPVRGWEICRQLTAVAHALPAIRHHHERLDGSGYPDGLSGDAIPLSARIMGTADAFDALTSDRPYRAKLGVSRAFAILRQETDAGIWDRQVLAALEHLAESGELRRIHSTFL